MQIVSRSVFCSLLLLVLELLKKRVVISANVLRNFVVVRRRCCWLMHDAGCRANVAKVAIVRQLRQLLLNACVDEQKTKKRKEGLRVDRKKVLAFFPFLSLFSIGQVILLF